MVALHSNLFQLPFQLTSTQNPKNATSMITEMAAAVAVQNYLRRICNKHCNDCLIMCH